MLLIKKSGEDFIDEEKASEYYSLKEYDSLDDSMLKLIGEIVDKSHAEHDK